MFDVRMKVPESHMPRLVAGCAPSAAATDALHIAILFQLSSRHSADTRAVEVCLFRLDAAQAAELLVALLLPLGNEHRIGISILQQPLVQLLADGLLLVVEIVYVAAPLVRNLENLPLRHVLRARRRGLVLRILHLVRKDQEVIFDVAEALWRRLSF